jgi:hypothetical protein
MKLNEEVIKTFNPEMDGEDFKYLTTLCLRMDNMDNVRRVDNEIHDIRLYVNELIKESFQLGFEEGTKHVVKD